jgi:predicted amidohydrolase
VREPLSIAVAQPLCVPYDVAANAVTHAAAVRAAGAQVVVFPELSLTGYELDAPAVTPSDPRLEPLAEACAGADGLALAGAPVPGGAGRPHIAMLAFGAAAITVAYRKMWLAPAEEARFAPGDKPAVLDTGGWRIGLAIGQDISVRQHQSDTAALGIDVYAAATLMFPDEAVTQDDHARRIAASHQVWVAVASFAGTTGGGCARWAGGSGIWAPPGAALAQAGASPGALARAVLG